MRAHTHTHPTYTCIPLTHARSRSLCLHTELITLNPNATSNRSPLLRTLLLPGWVKHKLTLINLLLATPASHSSPISPRPIRPSLHLIPTYMHHRYIVVVFLGVSRTNTFSRCRLLSRDTPSLPSLWAFSLSHPIVGGLCHTHHLSMMKPCTLKLHPPQRTPRHTHTHIQHTLRLHLTHTCSRRSICSYHPSSNLTCMINNHLYLLA